MPVARRAGGAIGHAMDWLPRQPARRPPAWTQGHAARERRRPYAD